MTKKSNTSSVSGKPFQPRSSKNTGPTRRTMATSRTLLPTPQSRDGRGGYGTPRDAIDYVVERQKTKNTDWPLSPVDSPANLLAPPDSDEVRQTTATSGQTCLRLYETSNPTGSSLKTFVASLLGTMAWYSKRYVMIWKTKTTPSNRLLFQLSASTPRTDGIGSGLLLTPTTHERPENPETMRDRNDRNGYKHGTKFKNLASQMEYGQLLPTPNASDGERGRRTGNKRGFGADTNDLIHQTGTETGKKLRLQPAMTEWMMGYPDGWTELPYPPHDTEKND